MKRYIATLFLIAAVMLLVVAVNVSTAKPDGRQFRSSAEENAETLIEQGRHVFRFDTFGDEAFWTDALHMQQPVSTLSPQTALALGLKVDAQALSPAVIQDIKLGRVNLGEPAVTLALIKQNAVVGVVGTFSGNTLTRVGFTCALCHSTVDNSVAPGIGNRIDGLANRDLNVGAIVATAPNLAPVVSLLRLAPQDASITAQEVRSVLQTWGPGRFDAELFLDGKAFNPQQTTNGVTTGTNVSGSTLIPNAYGLPGHNLHTWTGGWGTVTYWNAFVAVDELHGIGTFFDERFDDANQFPIAAAAKLGHVSVDPDSDQVTGKLPALHFYQLALPVLRPRPGIDFDKAAAARGDELFSGKANCNSCHHEPLWTEPGWNQHTAEEMKIDSFEADRSPGHAYQTMNLAGVFVRERGLYMFPQNKGRFYHDGRFKTLMDVVNSYDERFHLGLTDQEKQDLVEYLKSL
jgi:cytochrome c5